MNLETVSKIKRKDLDILIEALTNISHRVEEVILFGSCIEPERCKKESDIDICIISKVENIELMTRDMIDIIDYAESKGFNSALDIIDYRTKKELESQAKMYAVIETDIIKKGITIWKRGVQ